MIPITLNDIFSNAFMQFGFLSVKPTVLPETLDEYKIAKATELVFNNRKFQDISFVMQLFQYCVEHKFEFFSIPLTIVNN